MATAAKRRKSSADVDGAEEPMARRQRSLKVINPDLTVIVEDTKVQVNSIVLQLNSPVFAAMLSSDMKEGQSKVVVLPGKRMDEFCLFYQHLQACYAVTAADALVLCPWADEYQVDALRDACDSALANGVVDLKMLVVASKYNLPKLLAGCKHHFLGSERGLLGLKPLLQMQDGAAALVQLWPAISRMLGIQTDDWPTAESVKHMWPIVEKLVGANAELVATRREAQYQTQQKAEAMELAATQKRKVEEFRSWRSSVSEDWVDMDLDFLSDKHKKKVSRWLDKRVADLAQRMEAIK